MSRLPGSSALGMRFPGIPRLPNLLRILVRSLRKLVADFVCRISHSFECVLTYPNMHRQRWAFIDF